MWVVAQPLPCWASSQAVTKFRMTTGTFLAVSVARCSLTSCSEIAGMLLSASKHLLLPSTAASAIHWQASKYGTYS